MKTLVPLILIQVLFISAVLAQPVKLLTSDFTLVVSAGGQVTEMSDPVSGINYISAGQNAPLLKIRTGNDWEEPEKALFNKAKGIITLNYKASQVKASIRVIQHRTHISLELNGLAPSDKVDAVCWGPYPTSINQIICEVVGVVRNGQYAVGLQSLNTKTLGGLLTNAEGVDFTRGTVAVRQDYGSSLQAYSLDRSKPRRHTVWGMNYPDMPVHAIANETTLGSRIALFGCPENQVLQRIGEIEIAEGLPHPLINGVWVKQSPETGRAYLISDFNESNIDEILAYTRQAGLMSLYHEGPFQSWGHFILDSISFPNGNAGMKVCVDKAAKMGLRIGTHTLTSFITTNDPYVTPMPDKRLALTGSSSLSENITSAIKEIPVVSDTFFKNIKTSTLHAVKIGDELIRFREVTAQPPYILLDCQRGAFGSKATEHKKGEAAGMMLDYPYETLFPNFDLQQEIAGNMARFFNETGVSQMDFDGHEGCYSSGEGDYGMQAFAEKVFRETDHTLVNGTSRSSHFYWHICHYWNWGEPWYGGFRESQGDYRFENQPFLERNYMPNMLGWFLLTSYTTVEDIEWMMARAAGYDAGFAFVARYKNLKKNPITNQLLDLIRLWQEAYRAQLFSPDQKARLKNPENDFHLEKENNAWRLFPFRKYKFEHSRLLLQPGQPAFSEWAFENRDLEQPFLFHLTVMGDSGIITNPWIELDRYDRLEFPGEYKAGSSIGCDGKSVRLYDEKGSFFREIPIARPVPVLTSGHHLLKFDCGFPNEEGLRIRFVVKTMSSPEIIEK